MAKYLLLAMNGPTDAPDAEATYNKWYNEIHVPDLLAIDGVKTAQRYKILQSNMPEGTNLPYVAAYEIETDSIQNVFAAMEHVRPFTEAFDRVNSKHIMAVAIGPDA